MKKLFYILVILGIIMVATGITLDIIKETCYCKSPRDFFESKICQWLVGGK